MYRSGNGYHQRAAQIVAARVPKTVSRFVRITWADRTYADAEGVWLVGSLGNATLGHLRLRVRVEGGDPRVEILPVA